MLWFAKLSLELNTLFLMLPLLDTLSPSLLFSCTQCIFLLPLQTIQTCPVSLLLPRCLFLPVQHFFTSIVSWAQLREPRGKWTGCCLRTLYISYSDFPDLQGSQANGADSGAALRKLKFHLGLTQFSAVTQQHDPIFLRHGWEWKGLNACFGMPFLEQIHLGSLCSK